MLLRTDLARRTGMALFNNYRPPDPCRPLHARLRYQLGMVQSFWRELRRRSPDLVHVKTSSGLNFHQNSLYALSARLSGRPVLLQIHGGKFELFYRQSNRAVRAWIRHTLASVDRVAVLSRGWAECISRIAPRARTVVVPNGLEGAEIKSLSEAGRRRPYRVLFMGTGDARLNVEKGLEDLLAVLPRLLARHPEASFVLAGLDDPAAVRERVGESSERLTLLPSVAGEQRVSLFRDCSILAFPSHYENMPNVLLEGMAAGMGVVASRVGAIPEMLGAPAGGILFEARDREGLSGALGSLLGSAASAREQGRRNLATVKREYHLSIVERELERIYLDILAERRSGHPVRGSVSGRRTDEAPVL